MKIYLEEDKPKMREKKVMYSTSLPKSLKAALQKAVTALHRNKADWIRTSLNLFMLQDDKNQELLIINSFNKMELSHLRPFTTTLTEGQLSGLNKMAKDLKRSKADIVRAAIFSFLSKSVLDQEKEIKKYISR